VSASYGAEPIKEKLGSNVMHRYLAVVVEGQGGILLRPQSGPIEL